MRVTILEGTPEEIRDALPGLALASGADAVVVAAPRSASRRSGATEVGDWGPEAYVDERVARKVLTRRPLSAEQLKVLSVLYQGGNEGVLGTELQSALGYTKRAQFTGLMGAFGNRIANTPGYVDGTNFFDQEWVYDLATNRYRLPESVRAAMRAEHLV